MSGDGDRLAARDRLHMPLEHSTASSTSIRHAQDTDLQYTCRLLRAA